jgi:AraC family transcriptional regulator of adaptative response/methylated-DNA-[protein]-cysteine methyltransferase
LAKFKEKVREPKVSVTAAIYEAGFGSSSRLYESEELGMTPSAMKAGGKGEVIRYAIAETPLGLLGVGATARGICWVAFGESEDELVAGLSNAFPKAEMKQMDRELSYAVEALVAAMGESPKAVALPLDVRATAFQQRVWKALREIPRGETRTYSEIAEEIGSPASVRAVAGACAANPVALVVPCHRVVGKNGSLTGYRWGVERKRALLDAERGA